MIIKVEWVLFLLEGWGRGGGGLRKDLVRRDRRPFLCIVIDLARMMMMNLLTGI